MANYNFVATTLFGLEEILAREIQEQGGEDIRVYRRAVSFTGGISLMYKMNFNLRTAIRVLWKIKHIKLKSEKDLYNGVYSVPWEDLFSSGRSIAVNSAVASPFFNNSHFVSLKVKDAIVDRFRDKKGRRPDVDIDSPDVVINVHIHQANVDVSLDSSGDPLFKRGYRQSGYQAPVNEVLAAAMIKMTGWDGNSDFIDPMCGSGTLSTEAAMIAKNIPPGVLRKSFAFSNWENFDQELYSRIVEKSMVSREFNHRIFASDISAEAVDITRQNVSKALLDDLINIRKQDFFESKAFSDQGMIIINPPYGERISVARLSEFYKKIGDHLKHHYQGHTAWVLSSNLEALKHFGLRPGKKIDLLNGKIKCKYLMFELFRGKRGEFLEKKHHD